MNSYYIEARASFGEGEVMVGTKLAPNSNPDNKSLGERSNVFILKHERFLVFLESLSDLWRFAATHKLNIWNEIKRNTEAYSNVFAKAVFGESVYSVDASAWRSLLIDRNFRRLAEHYRVDHCIYLTADDITFLMVRPGVPARERHLERITIGFADFKTEVKPIFHWNKDCIVVFDEDGNEVGIC